MNQSTRRFGKLTKKQSRVSGKSTDRIETVSFQIILYIFNSSSLDPSIKPSRILWSWPPILDELADAPLGPVLIGDRENTRVTNSGGVSRLRNAVLGA